MSIKKNDILLKAIKETNESKRKNLIDSFFILRNKRRTNSEKQLGFKMDQYEKSFETMEGTARYVEYSFYSLFSKRQPDKFLKSDTAFKSYAKFQKFKLENERWLYMTDKTIYYYAIGFNMARLLDNLKVDYKSKLFNNGALTLEDILYNNYKNE